MGTREGDSIMNGDGCFLHWTPHARRNKWPPEGAEEIAPGTPRRLLQPTWMQQTWLHITRSNYATQGGIRVVKERPGRSHGAPGTSVMMKVTIGQATS